VVTTEYVEKTIPVQERPAKVEMPPVDWFVITEENLEEKLAEVKEKTGQIVFIAITPKGYENLALGIGDLRRYIKQQQSIIAYYEEAVTPTEPEPVEEEKEYIFFTKYSNFFSEISSYSCLQDLQSDI